MITSADKNLLIHSLIHDYAEKLFYFCLKKTSDNYAAEDLTSDILLNIITALEKGIVPEHFSSWVWQIARNRYSVWAGKKHKQNASESAADIEEIEIEDRTAVPEDVLIRKDQLLLLRREMSFISSHYRDIVVAYYFQGRKISDIALSLNLTQGTVMSKLHRARNILKEGMNMAREFGEKSYNPEQISFCTSGNQPSGLPWSAIKRKIPVNILCHAHNNPCTIQELALELGIAAPYMEEEVELLLQAELLKKINHEKYLTNFFIVPRECQNEINEKCCDFAEQHAAVFWQLAEKALKKATELGVTTGDYSDNDAQMFFAFYLEQIIENSCFSVNWHSHFKRADGGSWGLIGFESGSACRLPSTFFNNSGNGWKGVYWDGYQAHPGDAIFGKRRYKNDVPDSYLNMTLKMLAKSSDPASFSEMEKDNLQKLTEDGFCGVHSDGTAFVNALVFQDDMISRLHEYLNTLPEYISLLENMRDFFDAVKEIVSRYSNKYLQDDLEYYVGMSIVELRSVLSRLWKDKGFYTGESAQFCLFYC